MFLDLGAFFLEPVHVFLDLARGGGNLDIETRCMQEVVDAGEVQILKQQKRKKWWRGQWGKSTYEAKWMQEIERHIRGRESSILKQDERKKLLRDDRWSLDIETKWRYMKIHAKIAERRSRGKFLGPKNECRKQLRGTGWGEFRYWDKMHARRCWEKWVV